MILVLEYVYIYTPNSSTTLEWLSICCGVIHIACRIKETECLLHVNTAASPVVMTFPASAEPTNLHQSHRSCSKRNIVDILGVVFTEKKNVFNVHKHIIHLGSVGADHLVSSLGRLLDALPITITDIGACLKPDKNSHKCYDVIFGGGGCWRDG